MRVAPRRLVRAAAVLVSSSFLAIAPGCGGSSPQQQAAAPAPAGPKVLTPAERAAWYRDCWAHFNSKAWGQFKACYAEGAESDQVESGQPISRGIDAILANEKAFTEAIPDAKGINQLILVKGDSLAGISVLSGTHTGPLAGQGGQSIPSTGKPIGLLQGHVVQLDATGSRVVKDEFYMDNGTLAAQLGLSTAPARPLATSASTTPTIVVAGGTPAELNNVELMRAQMAAYNTHDVKGVDAYYAPDLVYHDMTAPKDQSFSENSAATQEFFKAFPDAKLTPLTAWGAGTYVVVTGRFEGTNRGPMQAMGLKKATNKAVSARYLDIARWENSKIKEEWLFYDGTAMARQLGLLKK